MSEDICDCQDWGLAGKLMELQASSGQSPEMVLNILQHVGNPSRNYLAPKNSAMLEKPYLGCSLFQQHVHCISLNKKLS